MDSLSAATSNSPPSTFTAPSSDSKQPTYTTAGTIYNPSSALPLQPPTRRGRSAKWTLVNPHSELSLLPKSILAGLSSKALATNSAVRSTSTLQQYTPLQQNYDRAVSPMSELEHAAVNMPLETPRMLSGNTTAPVHFPLADKEVERQETDKGTLVPDEHADLVNDEDDEDDDDDDDDVNMSYLKSMTVKSLNNLASYPNPTQKNAQKALLGKRSKLGSLPLTGNASSPSHFLRHQAGSSSDEQSKDFGERRMGLLRPAHIDASASLDHHPPARLLPTARSPSPISSVEADKAPALTTLANGPGAPRPLTAGPPGQRQYRPSTFESTFKALQSKHKGLRMSREDAEGFAIAHQTLVQVGIEDISSLAMESLEPSASDMSDDEDEDGDIATLVRRSEAEEDGPRRPGVVDASTTALVTPWDPIMDMTFAHWRDTSSSSRQRYEPGTARLSEQLIKARNERIAAHWYGGSELLGKSPDEVLRESNHRKLQRTYGAIGDGRPRKLKVDYRPIDVAEASSTPVSEHTKPLLNMAFATLVRHVEEQVLDGPFRQFGTPNKGLCDVMVPGGASVVGKPMEQGAVGGF